MLTVVFHDKNTKGFCQKKNLMDKLTLSFLKKTSLALIIIILPIFIISLVIYQSNKENIKNLIIGNLILLSENGEGQVYQFLEMSKQRVLDLSSDGFIRDSLQKGIEGKEKTVESLSDYLFRDKLFSGRSIYGIYISSLNGYIIASTVRSAIGKDVSGESFFIGGRNGLIVTESYTGLAGLPGLAFSAPITNRLTGKSIGVITNFILLTELNKILSGESFVKVLKTVKVHKYIVNKDKLMIACSDTVKGEVLKQVVNTLPVKSGLESDTEISSFYKDYRGIEVAGVSIYIPSMKWSLVFEIDKDKALKPVTRMRRVILITSIFVTGCFVLLFMLYLSYVVRPFNRILSAAKNIASGSNDISIPIKTSGDVGMFLEPFNIMANEIKAKTKELRMSEEMFSRILESAPDAIVVVNREGEILLANEQAEKIFGHNKNELVGKHHNILVPERILEKHDKLMMDYFEKVKLRPMGIGMELLGRRKDGSEFPVEISLSPVATEKGMLIISIVRDITLKKQSEYELKKFLSAIEQSVNIVFITSSKGDIEFVNPMFEQITGYSKEEAIGKNPKILASGEMTKEQYEEMWNTIISGKTWRGLSKNKKKNGEYYWCNCLTFPISDENGEVTQFLAIQEDITEKIKAEEKVKYLTSYDELTGLVNRARFMELMRGWILQSQPGNKKGALLLIGIDGFRFVNERYGQSIGDVLLNHVSRLFENILKEIGRKYIKEAERESIIGRLGGDEFAIFLSCRDEEEVIKFSNELLLRLEKFSFIEVPANLTASIGIVFYPKHGTSRKDLFVKADIAMYHAKELGRNRTYLYNPEDHTLEDVHSRLDWKNHILKALKEDRFTPWFQPILDIREDKIHHYEALARMHAEDGSIILPGKFIEVSERFGLIGAIDKVITEKVMKFQAELYRQGRDLNFGMNLSGKDLGNEEFIMFLQSKISETGADPKHLIFEITETAAIQNLDMAIKSIRRLKSMGCNLSLDDFGVGFTSFVYLKEMQVDYIKIDGSFIRELNKNLSDQIFVKAIKDVAKGLGIKTVAEFVENQETLKLLREYGVDYAQGYFIGKPSPNILS